MPATPVAAATGPYLVRDINTSGSSSPAELTEMNGLLYFTAQGGGKGRELWRSDGTANGTWRVKDIHPGSVGSHPFFLTAVGQRLYFSADDGDHGRELWTSDGTAAGTTMLKDINPGIGQSYPGWFTAFGSGVYFQADGGSTGNELWRTDGTAAGTKLFKDLRPGGASSNPRSILLFAGKLFLTAQIAPSQDAVYKSDGTAAGTKPLRDHAGALVTATCICGMWPVGSNLFFDKNEQDLWRTRGSAATTRMLAGVDVYNEFVGVGSTAFFPSYPGQLWKSDGTIGGTVVVDEIGDSPSTGLTDVGGTLLFFTRDGLWRSDGTTEGTEVVDAEVLTEDPPATLGSILYFTGYTAQEWDEWPHPSEPPQTLWQSDGTPEGTYSLGSPQANMELVTAVGSSIYFVSNAGGTGSELWRYVP